jgi:hypothetical protein
MDDDDLLEQPDFDHKMPAQMSVTQYDHWCARGKPPTAPMRRQAASGVDSPPPAPATERTERCTCPTCRGKLVPRGTGLIHATREFIHRQIAAAKEELRQEIRAAKREALDEARAEIRRAMDDDNVIDFKDLRRHA